jgi:hypothetical protein
MAVDVSVENAVALVTVDRQEAMNALDVDALGRLCDVLADVAADREVRCVILTGAGERAFIGGADIKYMAQVDAEQAAAFAALGHEAGRLLETMPADDAAIGYALGNRCRSRSPATSATRRRARGSAARGQHGPPRLGRHPAPARTTTLGTPELVLTGSSSAPKAYRRGAADGVDPGAERACGGRSHARFKGRRRWPPRRPSQPGARRRPHREPAGGPDAGSGRRRGRSWPPRREAQPGFARGMSYDLSRTSSGDPRARRCLPTSGSAAGSRDRQVARVSVGRRRALPRARPFAPSSPSIRRHGHQHDRARRDRSQRSVRRAA